MVGIVRYPVGRPHPGGGDVVQTWRIGGQTSKWTHGDDEVSLRWHPVDPTNQSEATTWQGIRPKGRQKSRLKLV